MGGQHNNHLGTLKLTTVAVIPKPSWLIYRLHALSSNTTPPATITSHYDELLLTIDVYIEKIFYKLSINKRRTRITYLVVIRNTSQWH